MSFNGSTRITKWFAGLGGCHWKSHTRAPGHRQRAPVSWKSHSHGVSHGIWPCHPQGKSCAQWKGTSKTIFRAFCWFPNLRNHFFVNHSHQRNYSEPMMKFLRCDVTLVSGSGMFKTLPETSLASYPNLAHHPPDANTQYFHRPGCVKNASSWKTHVSKKNMKHESK